MKSLFAKWLAAAAAAALFSMLVIQEPAVAAGKKIDHAFVLMTVHASNTADFVSELAFKSKVLTRALSNAKTEKAPSANVLQDVELTITQTVGDTGSGTHFRLEQNGHLWKESSEERIVLSDQAAALLIRCATALRNQHYGKLIAWNDAKQLLPNKSIFTVTDIESGFSFRVQRRAGSDHADVQPVTKEDTRIMKQIYNDKWSWNRKAVLVQAGGEWIAASMNGMPHGGDGIPENGFSGHSCIHFYLSSTHKSNVPDLAHQVMVHKAAGNLPAYFSGLSPAYLAKTFVAVMNHKETGLLRQLAIGLSEEKLASFEAEMESLSSIREELPPKRKRGSRLSDKEYGDALTAEVELPVSLERKGHSRQNGKYRFTFKRSSAQSSWHFVDVLTD
ncbi:hypothetical protein L1N85_14875 [Paenibacillus alkaliterrae]|uniref:hypothetical protein n=1 Tax=Paenibacillus alkaliterrae TaxID=320909 RepID=UPI001F3C7F67|nr:hypothetical protein [Paenibacillus alkaliterrae]MCF2939703.1 hypothetical protein [Paenibacillus alkaliterrae]